MALSERLQIIIEAHGAQASGEFAKVGASAEASAARVEGAYGRQGAAAQRAATQGTLGAQQQTAANSATTASVERSAIASGTAATATTSLNSASTLAAGGLQQQASAAEQAGSAATNVNTAVTGAASAAQKATPAVQGLAKSKTDLGAAAQAAGQKMGPMGQQAAAAGVAAKGAQAGFGGMAIAVLASAAVGAKLVTTYTDLAAEVRKVQGALGSSAETASVWTGAAKTMGVSTDDLSKGLRMTAKNIELKKDKLAEMGVEVVRNKDGTLNLSETVFKLGEQYRNTADTGQKNALAATAMGRSYQTMLPFLQRTREELESAGKSTGIMFKDSDLAKAREFEQTMRTLKTSLQVAAATMGKDMLPQAMGMAKVLGVLTGEVEILGKSMGVMRIVSGVFSGGLSEVFRKIGSGSDTQKQLAAATKEADAAVNGEADALDEAADAMKEAEDAAKELASAQQGLIGAAVSVGEAQDRLTKDVREYAEAKQDAASKAKAGGTEAVEAAEKERGALRSVISAVDAVAQAHQKDFETLRAASGQTFTAAESQNVYIAKLKETAATLSGPARAALDMHIARIAGLPPVVSTEARVDTGPGTAAIDGINSKFAGWTSHVGGSNPAINANNAPATGAVDGLNSRFGEWENKANASNPGLKANPEPGKASVADLGNTAANTANDISNRNPTFGVSVGGAISALQSVAQKAWDVAASVANALPGRQHGGPVMAGKAYIVGEAGPEMFVPATGGHIAPSVPPIARGSTVMGGDGASAPSGFGVGGDIVIQVDGREIARMTRTDLLRKSKHTPRLWPG